MENTKLWGGRFSQKSNQILEQFNASIPFDQKLYSYDIQGSKVHATMLAKEGIIGSDEKDLILQGLEQIEQEIQKGQFSFCLEDEDIHMAIEKRLIQIIGQSGKKLHTARSRNDQVALDLKLYLQDKNKTIQSLLFSLNQTLLQIAQNHSTTLLPGMTHLQHAQPINFGFLLCAYVCMFQGDMQRLGDAYKRHNTCPLGSAALAGTPYPINREFCAQSLGFDAPTLNAIDGVSNRDCALDFLYNLSLIAMHISRLSEELILWSSAEFGFISLSDCYATGSSIMPQKKNPDVPELLRGKTGRVYGNLIALLTTMKGLPLAYNKDMQEDKEAVFDSFETLEISLNILNGLLQEITIHPQNMLKACQKGHLSATDLADFLVCHCNIPFREAHHITGKAVAYAESNHKDLSELSKEELSLIDKRIPTSAHGALDLHASMQSRNCFGGTSTQATKEQISLLQKWLLEWQKEWMGHGQ